MKKLTGVQTVTGYAHDRREVPRILWASLCLLIRGNVAFKMSAPAGGVFVPDHATLEPCSPETQEASDDA